MIGSKKFFCMCLLFGCAVLFAQELDEGKKEGKPKKVYVPKNTINSEEYIVSNARIAKIKSIVQEKFDKHEDLESDTVRTAIEQEIGRSMPLVPATAPDRRSPAEIQTSQDYLVNAKFNQDIMAYKKAMAEEFDKKYPLYKKGDKVTIYYRRGSSTYRISGRYYGLGIGGNTIRINSKNIPVIDLLSKDRIHFDTQFHKEKSDEYVNTRVRKFNQEKNEYAHKLFMKEFSKQCKTNEQRGYILRNGTWESPKTILDEQMKIMVEMHKRRALKEAKEKAEQEKNKPAEQNQGPSPEKKDTESEAESDEE